MITKAHALQTVIDKWVLGDHPFSVVKREGGAKQFSIGCVYDPSHPSGGCAIGQFIPKELWTAGMEGTVATTCLKRESLRGMFEDPYSEFWDNLQTIHDIMGSWEATKLNNTDALIAMTKLGQNLLLCIREVERG